MNDADHDVSREYDRTLVGGILVDTPYSQDDAYPLTGSIVNGVEGQSPRLLPALNEPAPLPPSDREESARQIIALAREEAQARGSLVTCTEHLLVALARGVDPVGKILSDAGATPEALRATIAFVFGTGEASAALPSDSPKIERVMARATREAQRRGKARAGSDHLLFALLIDGGRATGVLTSLGIKPQQLRQRLFPVASSTSDRPPHLPAAS